MIKRTPIRESIAGPGRYSIIHKRATTPDASPAKLSEPTKVVRPDGDAVA